MKLYTSLRKLGKGQTLTDFLADHLILNHWDLDDELPAEDAMSIEILPPCKMYFDGIHIVVELVLALFSSIHKNRFYHSLYFEPMLLQ